MLFDVLLGLVLLLLFLGVLLRLGFHFVFHSHNGHRGLLDAGLHVWLHAAAAGFVRGVAQLLALLIGLVVILWHLSTSCLLHSFAYFLLVIILVHKILNGLLLLSDWLLLEVIARSWNIGHKSRVVQLKEARPAADGEDVMLDLAVAALGSKPVAVHCHELAVLIVDAFKEKFAEVGDAGTHQGLRDRQLQWDLRWLERARVTG